MEGGSRSRELYAAGPQSSVRAPSAADSPSEGRARSRGGRGTGSEDGTVVVLLPRQESFASLHILTRRASEGSRHSPRWRVGFV